MYKLFAVIALNLLSSAVGLFIASLLLDGFNITVLGFCVSVAIFTVAVFIVEPLVTKLSEKYLPTLRGGIALVATFLALFVTNMLTDGLSISGLKTWILAPLVVWVCVLIAGILLPMFIFKETLSKSKR